MFRTLSCGSCALKNYTSPLGAGICSPPACPQQPVLTSQVHVCPRHSHCQHPCKMRGALDLQFHFFRSVLCRPLRPYTCSDTQAGHSLTECAPACLLPGKKHQLNAGWLKTKHAGSIWALRLLKQDQDVIKMPKQEHNPCSATA